MIEMNIEENKKDNENKLKELKSENQQLQEKIKKIKQENIDSTCIFIIKN
jgi:hypothetical protein